jgi:hypothetical protein
MEQVSSFILFNNCGEGGMSKFISVSGLNVWHWMDNEQGGYCHCACGFEYPITKHSIIRERPVRDAKICNYCLREIGREMLTDFLGMVWADEPTYDELVKKSTSSKSGSEVNSELNTVKQRQDEFVANIQKWINSLTPSVWPNDELISVHALDFNALEDILMEYSASSKSSESGASTSKVNSE